MQDILEVLKSINFWTIAGSIAAVVGLIVTLLKTVKSKKTKRNDRLITEIISLSKDYETLSLKLLENMEHLSRKVASGTQNDEEGTKIQIFINTSSAELKAKANALFNNSKSSSTQAKTINELCSAAEIVYQNVAKILNNRGGSLSSLSEDIEKFTIVKNKLQ